jgi:hypothetical protein
VKALRVHRLLPMPGTTKSLDARDANLNKIVSKLKDPAWTANEARADVPVSAEIAALAEGVATATAAKRDPIEIGIMALASLADGASAAAAGEEGAGKSSKRTAATEAPLQETSVRMPKATARAGTPANADEGAGRSAAKGTTAETAAEKAARRASLPPLAEGDQFAIAEVDHIPGQTGAGVRAPGGLTSADTTTPLARLPETGETDTGVLDTKLPQDVTAMLEQSARKLSKGLSGVAGDKK